MADELTSAGKPNWFDKLIQKGLASLPAETGLFSSQPRPTNEKLFIQTVGQGRTNPINESDFTPEELQALQQLVYNNLKQQHAALQHSVLYNQELAQRTNDSQTKELALKRLGEAKLKLNSFLSNPQGSIGYGDYKEAPENMNLSQSDNPYGRLQTVLGRFSYALDPKTQMMNIADSYKFNTYKNNLSEPQKTGGMVESAGAGNIYPMLRDSAGRLLPPEKGVPVMINLDYKDPFGDTTK